MLNTDYFYSTAGVAFGSYFCCETQICYEQMHQFGRLFQMVRSSVAHPVPLPLEWIGKQLKRMPVRHDQSTRLRSAMDALMHAKQGNYFRPTPVMKLDACKNALGAPSA